MTIAGQYPSTVRTFETEGADAVEQDTLRDSLRDKEPGEIREEIEKTLGALAETVDELKAAIAPDALREKAKVAAQRRIRQTGLATARLLRDYAAPLALVGFGLGIVLAIRSSTCRSPWNRGIRWW